MGLYGKIVKPTPWYVRLMLLFKRKHIFYDGETGQHPKVRLEFKIHNGITYIIKEEFL